MANTAQSNNKRKKTKKRFYAYLLLVLLVSISLSLFFFKRAPLYADEALYARIIQEFREAPRPIPTYLGQAEPWKPPLGFYVLTGISQLVALFLPNLSPEILYRFPGVIFSALSALLVALIAKQLYPDEDKLALASGLIFALANETVIVFSLLLLDGPFMVFMLACLLMFLKAGEKKRYFYYAAVFLILALMTKTFVALLAPACAAIYYLASSKRNLLVSKEFVGCTLLIPIVLIGYAIFFYYAVPSKPFEAFFAYGYDLFLRIGAERGLIDKIYENTATLFRYFFPWALLPVAGAFCLWPWKHGSDRALGYWLLLCIIPLLSSEGYYWYFLPLIPILSILAAKAILKLDAVDGTIVFALFAISSLLFASGFGTLDSQQYEQKEIGIFLSEKGSLLTMSEQGLPGVMFYKLKAEKNPDYSLTVQLVTDVYGSEGYTTLPYVSRVVMDKYQKTCLNEKKREKTCVSQLISGTRIHGGRPEYVLLDSALYSDFEQAPLQYYKLAYNSSSGSYLILKLA